MEGQGRPVRRGRGYLVTVGHCGAVLAQILGVEGPPTIHPCPPPLLFGCSKPNGDHRLCGSVWYDTGGRGGHYVLPKAGR
jgi:hypothetical protein